MLNPACRKEIVVSLFVQLILINLLTPRLDKNYFLEFVHHDHAMLITKSLQATNPDSHRANLPRGQLVMTPFDVAYLV